MLSELEDAGRNLTRRKWFLKKKKKKKKKKLRKAMASSKQLIRSPSSLTRSPTLKSGIDSLACLEEGLHSYTPEENPNHHSNSTHRSEEENPKVSTPHQSQITVERPKSNGFPHSYTSEGNANPKSDSQTVHLYTESSNSDGNHSVTFEESITHHQHTQNLEENRNSNHSHMSEGIPNEHHRHSHSNSAQNPDCQTQFSQACSPYGHLHHTKSFKLRFLLPPLVVIILPCLYLYSRITMLSHRPNSRSYTPEDLLHHREDTPSDYIVLLFFLSAILISMRIAFPHVNLLYRFRALSSHTRACLAFSCLKPFHALIPLNNNKNYLKSLFTKGTKVVWTIGSVEARESLLKKQGKKTGERVEVYSNGDIYEGEIHHGRYCGSGVYRFYMSGKYEGDWIDGKYDGHGVETWSRGSRYCGQYKDGLRDGYGVYKFYTGDVYSGEWSHGQSHGRGIQTCSDGSRYVGEFKWGVKHGIGYYRFRNGDTYAGEYFADKMHGYGVYRFMNGHRYEGAWHEGKRQGLGMYTFRNGEVQAGHWHAGTLQTPSTQIYDPRTTMGINHSKVLHVVQEARDVALRARDLPRVDDKVNKAVAAANRAANAAKIAASKAAQNNKMSYTF